MPNANSGKRKRKLIFPFKVKEEDRGLVEKPEQLMLLPEYMEAWQRALDRQKEREEAAVKEAEDGVEDEDEVEEEVQSEDASQDESKSKDDEMEVDVAKETTNGVESSTGLESNTGKGNTVKFQCFAFCKGFTDEDCDVEEYFEENHENVEQVFKFIKRTNSIFIGIHNSGVAEGRGGGL